MKTFLWLLRREYWEHRGGFLWAPTVAAIIFLVLNAMALITGEVFMRKNGVNMRFTATDSILEQLRAHGPQLGDAVNLFMYSILSVTGIVLAFVVFFYALGALYDDRRDRSILLWKSLPISDRDTVLSKFVSATVTAPVIATLIGLGCGLGMLALLALWGRLHGIPVGSMLLVAEPGRALLNIVAALPVNAVWALPSIGWLLLVSAWARARPFLWAVGLPVGAGIVLSWLRLLGTLQVAMDWFWVHVVARLFAGVMPMGWLLNGATLARSDLDTSSLLHATSAGNVWAQLLRPDFYIGALIGILFLALAVRIRARRSEL